MAQWLRCQASGASSHTLAQYVHHSRAHTVQARTSSRRCETRASVGGAFAHVCCGVCAGDIQTARPQRLPARARRGHIVRSSVGTLAFRRCVMHNRSHDRAAQRTLSTLCDIGCMVRGCRCTPRRWGRAIVPSGYVRAGAQATAFPTGMPHMPMEGRVHRWVVASRAPYLGWPRPGRCAVRGPTVPVGRARMRLAPLVRRVGRQ